MKQSVHVLVPGGFDDPQRPSGGNTYDRRVCELLDRSSWALHVVELEGGWPWSAEVGGAALDAALFAIPDASLVVVDGLLASCLPRMMVPASGRLRVVLLMHMPIGGDDEGDVVRAAAAIITPSDWCRTWLLAAHGVSPARVHVARPGVDAAPATAGRPGGDRLLCVGAVTPGKGQDMLVEALAMVADLQWRCTCIGAYDVAPDFAAGLRRTVRDSGLHDRFLLVGPRAPDQLQDAYAQSDLLVVASRGETYAMVVSEALARGLPVIAADVGGVSEALGVAMGTPPGILVPPEDVPMLAAQLRRWLSDPGLRESLRCAALERRRHLTGWSITAEQIDAVLRRSAA